MEKIRRRSINMVLGASMVIIMITLMKTKKRKTKKSTPTISINTVTTILYF